MDSGRIIGAGFYAGSIPQNKPKQLKAIIGLDSMNHNTTGNYYTTVTDIRTDLVTDLINNKGD